MYSSTIQSSLGGTPELYVAIVVVLAIVGALVLWSRRRAQTRPKATIAREGIRKEIAGKAFCINCGAELPATSKFCGKCGSAQP
jgi:ribosomal protein L40E